MRNRPGAGGTQDLLTNGLAARMNQQRSCRCWSIFNFYDVYNVFFIVGTEARLHLGWPPFIVFSYYLLLHTPPMINDGGFVP